MKLKTFAPWKKSSDQPRQHIKKQRHYFVDKGPFSQSYCFSSSHVWMWELDYKESWTPKNWCLWTVMLEQTLECPLDCKEIQPHQSWIFTGRTDAEAEAPTLWLPDAKNRLIGKDSDAGKDWRWEKGMTEDEMVGWYHWFYGHEFEYALRVGDEQGSLVCCSPWGHKESDMTERLNCTELNWTSCPLYKEKRKKHLLHVVQEHRASGRNTIHPSSLHQHVMYLLLIVTLLMGFSSWPQN